MIDTTILPMYLTAVIALLLIPGPDMLLIASSSLSYGKKVGLSASLGNATSGIILSLLAALGISVIVEAAPITLDILRLIGGAYLMKMAWDSFRTEVTECTSELGEKLAGRLYKRAMLSNLLNPKALLFFILFLPQFVSTDIATSAGVQLLSLGLLLNVLGLTFNILLVLLASQLGKPLLQNARFRNLQHKLMGAVFLILAIGLLTAQIGS
ncbi:LysE family translocator [Thaumasiovibrio subtropicus]|uniref:LysE family translocator n=1 Tax=Thaumasiovibrio subtropicus TaxID=1891207 RepID=UPI000B361CCD|nr:LysE family translocator [Thaumasiovibrio subtropicus]